MRSSPTLYPGDVRFAFAVLALAGLLLVLLVLTCIGAFFMKRPLLIGCAVVALGLSLSACGGLSALSGDGVGKQVLTNLEGCDRHYEGAIGAGVNGSFRIDCKAQPLAAGQVVSAIPPGDPSAIPR